MKQDTQGQFPNTSVIPRRMRYGHIWKASKTHDRAFEFDPFLTYLRAGVTTPYSQRKALSVALLTWWKKRQLALTVNRGSAFVIVFPESGKPQAPVDRWLNFLWKWCKAHVVYKTPEQRKRAAEFIKKSDAIVKEVLGDRVLSMLYVALLATDPESQGHGYGGALLETVNDIADAAGKASWLHSSNILNESFYNSHGFKTVGSYFVGNDNPKWTGKPVLIQVMVREPKNKLRKVLPPLPSNLGFTTSIAPQNRMYINCLGSPVCSARLIENL